MSTRKSRRAGNDVRFCDGDRAISTTASRAQARLDHTRTQVMAYVQVMR